MGIHSYSYIINQQLQVDLCYAIIVSARAKQTLHFSLTFPGFIPPQLLTYLHLTSALYKNPNFADYVARKISDITLNGNQKYKLKLNF